MSTKVNVLKAQIAKLQAEVDKIEKPNRILDDLRNDLECVEDDIDCYKHNLECALGEVADYTKSIQRCEKERQKILDKIAKVKKGKK